MLSTLFHPTESAWTDAMRQAVAYSDTVTTDPVFTAKGIAGRALAWRGVLLRHHSVGPWRRLWAALVEHVRAAARRTPCATRPSSRINCSWWSRWIIGPRRAPSPNTSLALAHAASHKVL